MTANKFKSVVDLIMKGEGFSKKGTRYYLSSPEIICSAGLQKSNYSNYYYFNVGYFILQLDSFTAEPKETEGHIRTRMVFNGDSGKNVDYLDLSKLNEEDTHLLEISIKENIFKLIKGSLSLDGLKKLLNKNPELLYQTTTKAKSFLGFM